MMSRTARKSILLLASLALAVTGCATQNTPGQASAAAYSAMISRERKTAPREPRREEIASTAEEYERIGDLNLRNGDIPAAFLSYTKALEKEPGRVSAAYKTGRLFLAKGMAPEARSAFEKILKKEPKNARV
jgi:Flp pilus assembly protein TadD